MKFVDRARSLCAVLGFLAPRPASSLSPPRGPHHRHHRHRGPRSRSPYVPFRAEEGLAADGQPVVAADLARTGLFKLVDARWRQPLPYEPSEVNYATGRARGADALVIGKHRAPSDGRYDVRFRLIDVAKQVAARELSPTGSRRAAARHRPPHRRRHLREADRRHGRVLHQDHLRREARQALRAAGRRRRRLQRRRRCSPRTSRSSRRRGRPTAAASPTFRSTRRSRSSSCRTSPPGAAGGGQFPRQQQRAGLVARRPPARGRAHQGRRLADLRDQRRRRRRAAPHASSSGIDTEPTLFARRAVDPLHLRPRRQPADLPHAGPGRPARAPDLRGHLQRVAAPSAPTASRFAFVQREGARFRIAIAGLRARARCRCSTEGALDDSPTSRRTVR